MGDSNDRDSNHRDKAQRLIRFLREYVQLGQKVKRDISDYQRSGQVVWFHQVPRLPWCRGVLWGDELGEKVWLEVRKPDMADPPSPKLGLKPWIKVTSPVSEPVLRDHVRMPDPVARRAGQAGAFTVSHIEDNPEKREEFEHYLESWRVWEYRNRSQLAVLKIYNDLFNIYRSQRQEVESMEVVIGLGLASWRPLQGAPCRRHVVTARAELEFDLHNGILTLRCPDPPEGAAPLVEDQFLPVPLDGPTRDQVQEELTNLGDDVFNLDGLNQVLKAIANAADPTSDTTSELEPRDAGGPHLRVDLAPAIILRKRGVASLVRVYDDIADQLADASQVPIGVLGLLDPMDATTARNGVEDPTTSASDPELYFPLLANEAQERIATTLAHRHSVLVQGPPGTGKSHTIANLVCHLLAHGQRVLVTSETARALSVLKGMLPAEVQPLCVSLLGASTQALSELTESVNRMTERHATFDAMRYKREIQRSASDLREARELRATVEKRLMEMRQAETMSHRVNDAYEGTPTAIARAVQTGADKYGWFQAEDLGRLPLRNAEALELLSGLRELTPEREAELRLSLPDREALPTPEAVEELLTNERNAQAHLRSFADVLDDPWMASFDAIEESTIDKLREGCDEALVAVESIRARADRWGQDAIRDAFSDDVRRWGVIHDKTVAFLDDGRSHDLAETVDATTLGLPADLSRRQIIDDAQTMRRHLESGGRWKRFGIPTREARERLYLRDIRVGHSRAETASVLAQLAWILEFRQSLTRIWRIWDGLATPTGTSASLQVAELESANEVVDAVLSLHRRLEELWATLSEIPRAPAPPRTPAGLERLRSVLTAASARREAKRSEAPLAALEQRMEQGLTPGTHPIGAQLLNALKERDLESWLSSFQGTRELQAASVRRQRTEELLNALQRSAPAVADRLRAGSLDPAWDERLADIEGAFAWAQAQRWLKDIGDHDALLRLDRDYEELTQRIGQMTAELAATKAWHEFLERLTPEQTASLQAWSNAIKRIGKGTGRHAPHWRKEAQKQMAQCAPAIPAWIMPRYRIPELMRIEQGMFDVAIIDEASQTGIDGLFLHYIAERTVIVGDDQQISPAGVGVPQDAVFDLQREHLDGVFLGSQLDAETSMYDVAKILVASQSRLVLQEHFRCMPEIIRYSNNLCYAPYGTPLIPLRSYSPDRLPPLMDVYVDGGYQEGSSSTMRNLPEAEALADAVAKCVQTPEYADMTMGVISLTGTRQAQVINQMLLERLGSDVLEERQLVCGDAYSFQGNERDVMFLSLVAAPENGSHVSALTATRYRQRFNVAASRARDQMWLFHSAKLEHLSQREDCVRRLLVEFFAHPNDFEVDSNSNLDVAQLHALAERQGDRGTPPRPFGSWFEVDVYLALVARGYVVRPQFPVASYRIDLVVDGVRTRLAIECDGDYWHGPERYQQDLRRQRQLERAGWQFFRLRGSEYYMNRERALEPLWTVLDALDITPWETGTGDGEEEKEPTEDASSLAPYPPPADYTTLSIEPERASEHPTSDELAPPPSPMLRVTAATLGKLFQWARTNVLLSVPDRVGLADIDEKVSRGDELTDDDLTELRRILDVAVTRGFKPDQSN